MSKANKMPKEEGIDHTLTLLKEGYMYILNRRQSFHSNLFETRLMGQKAICMGGREAAELFYDTDKFKRIGAAPNRLQETLFGKGAIQGLDGKAHKHRKKLFMSVMTPEYLHSLTDIHKKHWDSAIKEWEKKKQIILYQEVKEILCKTACEWVGIPLEEKDVISFTNDLAGMFESPAEIGPAHWRGRRSRNKIEHQLQKLVDIARETGTKPTENTIFYQFSKHQDVDGNLLDSKMVAVELINLLRPIVAIAIYVNFVFLALYHNPEEKEKLLNNDDTNSQMFIQEVRRFYPFFPALVALVKKDFTWNNFDFKKDTLTLLDLYGTNHDPNIWDNPGVFDPNRFAEWSGSPFDFIPQGGGDHFLGHRCAGEWATMEIMKVSLEYLTHHISYEVPDEQDLSFSMVKIPSIPKSEIILKNIMGKG